MFACGGSSTSSSSKTSTQSAPIKVVVRLRPLLANEAGPNARKTISVLDKRTLAFDPKTENADPWALGYGGDRMRGNKDLVFTFDHVFGPESSNKHVYRESISETVSKLINGYNCSIFAYGPTGSGKTHTMIGSPEEEGVIYLLLEEAYARLESEKNLTFDINISYLEVYNENVRDLLKPGTSFLSLREDGSEIFVHGLRWFRPSGLEQIMQWLKNGNAQRTQHPTDANAESSRSHAVFQVRMKLTRKDKDGMVVSKNVVRLNMIDLAGSERAAANNNNAQRLHEGANINKSLLALGNCIQALATGRSHVPYRDSKLTRLLKGVLGGNSYTVMMVNVSPAMKAYEETYNTLRYASRATKIKNCVSKILQNSSNTLSLALEQAQGKIAALVAEKEELSNQVLALQSARCDRSAEKVKALSALLQSVLSAKQAEAICTDLAANLESHLKEMSFKFDEKIEKLDRLDAFALAGDIAVNKVQEQRVAKCASMRAQLEAAQRKLTEAESVTLSAELNLEQWLQQNGEPWTGLVETIKHLREYKSLSEFVVCRVQMNHYKSALEKQTEEKRELHQLVCLIAEQYSKIIKKSGFSVTREMISSYRKIMDLVRRKDRESNEDLQVQRLLPEAFTLKDSPGSSRGAGQRAATYRQVRPAPPRLRTTRSNCTPPAAAPE